MAEIVSIGAGRAQETIVEFVTRRTVVTSDEVGRRFGMSYDDAHKQMRELQRTGKIVGRAGGDRKMVWAINESDFEHPAPGMSPSKK